MYQEHKNHIKSANTHNKHQNLIISEDSRLTKEQKQNLGRVKYGNNFECQSLKHFSMDSLSC